jgi:hypothetical protein
MSWWVRSCGYEEGVVGAQGTACRGAGGENGKEKSEKGGNWGCMSKETALFFHISYLNSASLHVASSSKEAEEGGMGRR